jgi:hypothetical protein
MKKHHLIIYLLSLMCLISPITAAKIYSYVDSNGVRIYTDEPPAKSRTLVKVQIIPQSSNSVNIYKFVDSNGITHFTNKPKHSGYKLIHQGGNYLPSFSSSIASSPIIHKRRLRYKHLIQKVANHTGLEAAFLHAIIQTESAYNSKAISPKGAVGLMQLMPATAKRFGVKNRTNASSNIYGGARYLRFLLKLFNNNRKLAVAAYNAGENAVKRYGNKIPPYRETRNYVKKVMRLYRSLQSKI